MEQDGEEEEMVPLVEGEENKKDERLSGHKRKREEAFGNEEENEMSLVVEEEIIDHRTPYSQRNSSLPSLPIPLPILNNSGLRKSESLQPPRKRHKSLRNLIEDVLRDKGPSTRKDLCIEVERAIGTGEYKQISRVPETVSSNLSQMVKCGTLIKTGDWGNYMYLINNNSSSSSSSSSSSLSANPISVIMEKDQFVLTPGVGIPMGEKDGSNITISGLTHQPTEPTRRRGRPSGRRGKRTHKSMRVIIEELLQERGSLVKSELKDLIKKKIERGEYHQMKKLEQTISSNLSHLTKIGRIKKEGNWGRFKFTLVGEDDLPETARIHKRGRKKKAGEESPERNGVPPEGTVNLMMTNPPPSLIPSPSNEEEEEDEDEVEQRREFHHHHHHHHHHHMNDPHRLLMHHDSEADQLLRRGNNESTDQNEKINDGPVRLPPMQNFDIHEGSKISPPPMPGLNNQAFFPFTQNRH